MHIPDGLVWPALLVAGWGISVLVVSWAVKRTSSKLPREKVPFMALLAAGIFVAQMLNFPIGGGTTGHLVGAALATAMLGLAPAVIAITLILLIQALLFGDGGITALGLNILNMAIVGCGISYLILRGLRRTTERFAVLAAAWTSVFLAALACAVELGLSYSASDGSFGIPMLIALPSMLGYHALIGVGEAILTLGIIAYLAQVLPDATTAPARGV